MRIGIDILPINNVNGMHKVRGSGMYVKNLINALQQYHPENEYIFLSDNKKFDKTIDLIHYPYFEPFFLSLPLLKNTNSIVTVHDLIPLIFSEHFPSGLKGKVKWIIQSLSLKNKSAVITDSVSSKKDIVNITGINHNKVYVINLAADDEFKKELISNKEAEKLRTKYNLPDNFVLYVGDVTWNKNLPNLIKAVNKTDIKLVMVGRALLKKEYDHDNPWNSDLVIVHKLLNENNNIVCTGFVEQQDLVKIYNLAKVFVMPSIYEGFGLPVLEAASCGCPVITTKCGSLPEVMQDAAVYVDPYDIDNMANSIEEIYTDQNLQKKLSKQAILQSMKFSWKKTADDTIKVYEKIVKE